MEIGMEMRMEKEIGMEMRMEKEMEAEIENRMRTLIFAVPVEMATRAFVSYAWIGFASKMIHAEYAEYPEYNNSIEYMLDDILERIKNDYVVEHVGELGECLKCGQIERWTGGNCWHCSNVETDESDSAFVRLGEAKEPVLVCEAVVNSF